MKKNMGIADRIIRGVAAFVLGYLSSYNIVTGNLVLVFMMLSIALFVTALFGYCPLYALFRINTMSHKQHDTFANKHNTPII